MEPVRYDGPSIDYGVERRLRRLNPNLKVTWSPYALDHLTGRPIEMSGALDCYTGEFNRGPVKDPGYYLWIKDGTFSTYYLVAIYQKFGHEEVMHLEADVARHMDHSRVFEFLEARGKALRERGLSRKRDAQKQKVAANKKRIHDLVFEGKSGVRDAKVSSYKGQTRRLSSNELNRIRMDPREDGWELPEGPSNESE